MRSKVIGLVVMVAVAGIMAPSQAQAQRFFDPGRDPLARLIDPGADPLLPVVNPVQQESFVSLLLLRQSRDIQLTLNRIFLQNRYAATVAQIVSVWTQNPLLARRIPPLVNAATQTLRTYEAFTQRYINRLVLNQQVVQQRLNALQAIAPGSPVVVRLTQIAQRQAAQVQAIATATPASPLLPLTLPI